MIQYRALLEAELSPSLFDAFVRRQVVSQCWRKRGGVWRAVEHNIWTYPISMYRKSCAAAASAHGCFPLPSSLHAAMRLKSCIFPPIPLWKAKPFTVLWAA